MHSASHMQFRAAKPEDAGAIRDVVRAAYARWIPIIGREPRPMVADYERAIREHQIDVMVTGSRILGLIETMLREDHLWIENIAVMPEDQGKGLGRQLLAYAERKADEAQCAEIRLLTNAAFEANISLYEKAGYVIVKQEPFMGGTTVYMSKALTRQ
jgi:ribosomal protein S18 acetylase RimI-like enzyme